MSHFTIKDLENLSGIKAHTLRIWEQRYGFLKPARSDSNIRYYSNDDLKTILNIALLSRHGAKISHIDKLTAEEISQKVLELEAGGAEQERHINELINCMLDMDFLHFECCVHRHLERYGLSQTLTEILFPFIERVGLLWLAGHVNPAQEHLVTNLMRQKIVVAIDALPLPGKGSKQALLFLPEGEYHELGLLYIYFLLKHRGVHVIYLGANVPVADVVRTQESLKPIASFTHLTSVGKNFNLDGFLHELRKSSQHTVYISGRFATSHMEKFSEPFILKHSLADVCAAVDAL